MASTGNVLAGALVGFTDVDEDGPLIEQALGLVR
jgi:hypothetical protein